MTNERVIAGRYLLGELLGRGGMASVYAATDTVLGRQVAIKIVDLSTAADPVAEERFRREARTTASLAHPGIVTVFDTGVVDHTAYLVMERLPGRTLADRLHDEGPLSIAQVRDIGAQVASALAAAHAAGIVHRDIKPGNIAQAAAVGDKVKVLDFGITQLLGGEEEHHPLTKTNMVMGTSEYLAPEQGVGGAVDARADLYALGCVLFALLTGKPPFSGRTPVAVLMKHQQQPVPDLAALRPDAPPDLVALVERLLAKNPDDRPQSADLVAQALRSPGSAAATEILGAAPAGAATATVLPAAGHNPARGADPRTAALAASNGPTVSRQAASGPPTGAVDAAPTQEQRSKAWIPLLLLLILAMAAAGLYLGTRSDNTPSTPSASAALTPVSSETPSQTPSSPESSATPSASASSTPTASTSSASPSVTPSASPSSTSVDLTSLTKASDDLGAAMSAGERAKVLTAQQASQGGALRQSLIAAARGSDRAGVSAALDGLGTIVQSASAQNNGNSAQEALTNLTSSYAALSQVVDQLPFMS